MSTVIKGKIIQIIEHKDKEEYILPQEFIKSEKNVIVLEIKEAKGLKGELKRFFSKTDEYTRILLSNNVDYKIDETVSLKVKPLWVKTRFFEIDEE